MSIHKKDTEGYPIECLGMNHQNEGVFDKPVMCHLTISEKDSKSIESEVTGCPYNHGRHEHLCKAEHPHLNIDGDPYCPYVISLPAEEKYLAEHKRERAEANKDLYKIAGEEDSLLHPYAHLFAPLPKIV